ncbi:uncharacterized protein V1518DRAFT_423733 [Limtongia smithiae]|uniref:uncharacterized protein n=1 Tax=Limtongia smithiae TaxID=1125753 RepID=UPI0034CD9FBB
MNGESAAGGFDDDLDFSSWDEADIEEAEQHAAAEGRHHRAYSAADSSTTSAPSSSSGTHRRSQTEQTQPKATQMTLFGHAVSSATSVATTAAFVQRLPREFVPLWRTQSPYFRSNHTLVRDALRTWKYPTNVPVRDYQRNIAERALLSNVLCSLPTGLGKTLIAAVVMLNWYRWTADSKIVFMAPTKPLVSQQAEACYKLVGIPRHDTAVLIGSTASQAVRDVIWQERRVFFVTPQTLQNDLSRGAVDPKKIVCLIVDEAHRATGEYSYVNVVKFLRRFSEEFRVLALSATPGSNLDAVQEVITNLAISHAEIRTEASEDVKDFVRGTEIEHLHVDLSPEQETIMSALSAALQPYLTKLNNYGVYYVREVQSISLYGLMMARKTFREQTGRFSNPGLKWQIEGIVNVLLPLAHGVMLLKNHGIRPFAEYMTRWENSQRHSDDGKTRKMGKTVTGLLDSSDFKRMKKEMESILARTDVVSHSKIDELVSTLEEYFSDPDVVAAQSKVIVFCEYRASASELNRVLAAIPNVKPHLFFGQAVSKDLLDSGIGMSQKEQLKVLADFKDGKHNTLIATSIGEEGLDIGQVDMIICYDASASPVRVLQRMGRTGRFRKGRIVAILTEQERTKWNEALAKYSEIQRSMLAPDAFNYEPCARIFPTDVPNPVIDLRKIEIPAENEGDVKPITAASLKKRTTGEPKLKAMSKKFNMPDNVETSFRSASSLLDQENTPTVKRRKTSTTPAKTPKMPKKSTIIAKSKAELNTPANVDTYGLLTPAQSSDLSKTYKTVYDAERANIPTSEHDPITSLRTSGGGVAARIGHSRRTEGLLPVVDALRKGEVAPSGEERFIDRFGVRLSAESFLSDDDGRQVVVMGPRGHEPANGSYTHDNARAFEMDVDNNNNCSSSGLDEDIEDYIPQRADASNIAFELEIPAFSMRRAVDVIKKVGEESDTDADDGDGIENLRDILTKVREGR